MSHVVGPGPVSSHTNGDTTATPGWRSNSRVRVSGPRSRASGLSSSKSALAGACFTNALKAAAKPRFTDPKTQCTAG
jgi:hypothetical protein